MPPRLGEPQASAAIAAMRNAATERNLRMSVAVVDSGGELVQFYRMDGTSPLSTRMAVNKGYTSAKWTQDTKAIKTRMFDPMLGADQRDIAWFGDPRFTAVWGGVVIRADDGTVLGAVGTSGGVPAEDEEVAQVGAEAIRKRIAPLDDAASTDSAWGTSR
jgi:uncharacterized protein GlcG (DUF336 family)